MSNFGTCWSCGADGLTFPARMVSGNRVVAEAIVRRWSTPRGRLIDDPNYGYSLMDLLNEDIAPSDVGRISYQAAREAEKDERVLSCELSATYTDDGKLSLDATVHTASGSFRLVADVSQVSIELLQPTVA